MADLKISQLVSGSPAGALDGTEGFAVVQGGASKGATALQIAVYVATTLAAVASSGAYADLSGTPALGTAAAIDVGTGANEIVQLDGTGKLPAVDGSALTNLPAGGASVSDMQMILSMINMDGNNDSELNVACIGTNAATAHQITAEYTALAQAGGDGLSGVTLPAATGAGEIYYVAAPLLLFSMAKIYADGSDTIDGSADTLIPNGLAQVKVFASNSAGAWTTLATITNAQLIEQVINASTKTGGATDLNGLSDCITDYGASGNMFLGNLSGVNATVTATENTALGTEALAALTDGVQNTAIGLFALGSNLVGGANTAVGVSALGENTADDNTAVGKWALGENTTGTRNTALGSEAAAGSAEASDITAVGYRALWISTGANNTVMGSGAMIANTTGAQNTAMGKGSADSNTSGSNIVAIGYNALSANTTASNSVAIGVNALQTSNTNDNVAIGFEALKLVATGGQNFAGGSYALATLSDGVQNVAIGDQALFNQTVAIRNTAIGMGTAYALTTGERNTFLGAGAAGVTTGDYNTVIGEGALVSAGAAENRLALGHDASATVDNAGQIGDAAFTNLKIGTTLGSIQTGNTTNTSSAAWILGNMFTEAVTPDATQYLEVQVGGTVRKLIVAA